MMKSSLFAVLTLLALVGCERAQNRKFDTERSSAGYRAAMADYQAGRLQQAVEGLEKVVDADPVNASARFQLACLKQDYQRDYLGAMLEFREFVRLAAKSDRTDAAEARLKRCRELFTAECAASAMAEQDASSGRSAEVLAKLQKENAELTAKVESAQRAAEVQKREVERLRKMMQSVGTIEGDETARPSKIVITDADLLDEPGDDVSSAGKKNNFAALIDEAAKLESEAAPLSREVAVKQKPVERPAPTTPTADAHPATYVVQEGDTLIGIAKRFYSDASKWKVIRDANKATISVDGRVRSGMEIKLP